MVFFQGLIVGLAITAPIGPITVLCIDRTLKRGILSGIFSGLGSATAYAVGGVVAAIGISFFIHFLNQIEVWLKILGGIFLMVFGGVIVICPPRFTIPKAKSFGYFKDFSSTFLLTISNPLTFLAFVGIFVALGLIKYFQNYGIEAFLPFGVFLGSAIWWLLLVEGMSLFRNRVTRKVIQMINRSMGILIFILGFFTLFISKGF